MSAFLAMISMWLSVARRSVRFLSTVISHGLYEAVKDVAHEGNDTAWVVLPTPPFLHCIVVGEEDSKRVMSEVNMYLKPEEIRERLVPSFGRSLVNLNTLSAADREEVWKQKRLIGRLINHDSQYLLQSVINSLIADIEGTEGRPFNLIPLVSRASFTFMLGLVYGKDIKADDEAFKVSLDALVTNIGYQLMDPMFPLSKVAARAEECSKYIERHIIENEVETGCKYPIDVFRVLGLAGYTTIIAQMGNTVNDLAGRERGWEYQDQMAKADEMDAREMARKAIRASGALRPPAPNHMRIAHEDDVLPSGHVVKKGHVLFVSLIASRSDTWDPEAKEQPYDALFGFGPRSCTGKHLALKFLVEALTRITATFELRLAGASKAKPLSLLYEYENVPVIATRR